MLVSRCSSQLSSHKLQAKSKKSQALSEADLSRLPRPAVGRSRRFAMRLHPSPLPNGSPLLPSLNFSLDMY